MPFLAADFAGLENFAGLERQQRQQLVHGQILRQVQARSPTTVCPLGKKKKTIKPKLHLPPVKMTCRISTSHESPRWRALFKMAGSLPRDVVNPTGTGMMSGGSLAAAGPVDTDWAPTIDATALGGATATASA